MHCQIFLNLQFFLVELYTHNFAQWFGSAFHEIGEAYMTQLLIKGLVMWLHLPNVIWVHWLQAEIEKSLYGSCN